MGGGRRGSGGPRWLSLPIYGKNTFKSSSPEQLLCKLKHQIFQIEQVYMYEGGKIIIIIINFIFRG